MKRSKGKTLRPSDIRLMKCSKLDVDKRIRVGDVGRGDILFKVCMTFQKMHIPA